MFLSHVKRLVLKDHVFVISLIICLVFFLLIEANFVLLKLEKVRKNEVEYGDNLGSGLRRSGKTKSH